MGSLHPPPSVSESRERRRLELSGAVQGVGFRPFVYRLAQAENLAGVVRNDASGVTIEIEGTKGALDRFEKRLTSELPTHASILTLRVTAIPCDGGTAFAVAPSALAGSVSALVMADLATCPDCLAEIFDPGDRRYRYPFTSCVACGPRYSIVEALPYDRARTAMRHFPLCPACAVEYADPASRRFHAESTACPDCGPRLALWDGSGATIVEGADALSHAADALRRGAIVALKGLGGFQLLVDARNEAAVNQLRVRKRRPGKPFALMVDSVATARSLAEVSRPEQQALESAAAPIVLLRRLTGGTARVAEAVAPRNGSLGIMLPSTPLHHVLMRDLGFPIVATSGNRGGEPIVADESSVLERLGGIADLFLVHNRPILRPVDDSMVRVIGGRETVLRRARGYAPLPVALPALDRPVLALGGHMKSAVATGFAGQVFLGPHIGDLDGPESRAALARGVDGMQALHGLVPAAVACDLHPDYHTTQIATRMGPPVHRVQHHLAHVLACMADNGLDAPFLGVAWDGTGFGNDGTIWGGEFIAIDRGRWRRAAHFLPFRLPGAEAAMREPRRTALGVLFALHGAAALSRDDLAPVAAFSAAERTVLRQMLERGVNAPVTSSVGRLFDAVAALLGLCQRASFEGEAAMAVEDAAERAGAVADLPEPVIVRAQGPLVIDWRPTLAGLIDGLAGGIPADELAAGFHAALARSVVAAAERNGIRRVGLTGGCFQNKRLVETVAAGLSAAGFEPYWHHRVPPNDGGLAVGQAAFAARPLAEEKV